MDIQRLLRLINDIEHRLTVARNNNADPIKLMLGEWILELAKIMARVQ